MADAAARARFLANEGQKLPPKPKRETPSPKREPMKRGKGLPHAAVKQLERTAFLHGIFATKLVQQRDAKRVLGIALGYQCETCGERYQDWDEAWECLTVSHIEPRNDTASRYERRREPDLRGDHPDNIVIECVSCNQDREPQPEWSAAP